jgi:thermitase
MPSLPRRSQEYLASVAFAIGFLLVLTLVAAPAAHAASRTPHLIVGFRTDGTSTQRARALRGAGATYASRRGVEKTTIKPLRAVVVPVTAKSMASVRARLLARADVAYVELDHVAHAYDLDRSIPESSGSTVGALWTPNDSMLLEQWSLATMNVPAAWDITRGSGVTVAVLDTGVDYDHPDLRDKVIKGHDFVGKDEDPMDEEGHGTHVSGVIAANADDGYGIAGIAPNAKILAVRVLDKSGSGDYSWVANGIVYAVQHGAKVINLSLGGPDASPLLESAVNYAAARGVTVACASGNETAKLVGYPARYDSCFSVGATGLDDEHADFSNIGPGLDIAAPGVQILSSTPGGNHEAWDGTSMASPAVAGLAALLASQGLGRRAILSDMQSTAADLGAPGTDKVFGAGRIDIGAAVLAASRQPRAAADRTAPHVAALKVLKPRKVVHTTSKIAWKVKSSTKWTRVGTTPEAGTYAWSQTSTKGATRTVANYRAQAGIVYRRIVKSVKRKVTKRTVTLLARVRVTASDDVGVDRAALEVDGVSRAVDWSAADGWILETPCAKGRHRITVGAWDVADNAGTASATVALGC